MHLSIVLLFLVVLFADSYGEEEEDAKVLPIWRGEVEIRFPKQAKPFVLHKNQTLLNENNGTIKIYIRPHDGFEMGHYTHKAIQVEMMIENEEPGKVYTDFAFDDWSSNHQAEIVGEQPGKTHQFVFNRGSIYFRYNESAPNFTMTITQIPFTEGCECGYASHEYPRGIRQPSRFPGIVLANKFPKNCSRILCGWNSERNLKFGQEIDFSFLGTYDPNDRFYIRNSKGTISLLPESKQPFKRFKMLINEPFMIYFVGSDQPQKDRHMNLLFAYEAKI